MASETREDIVRTLEAIIANDRTTYRHGQKRPDGKKPSQAEKPGSIWLTPKEMASTLIAKLRLDKLKESQAPSPGVTSEQAGASERCPTCGSADPDEKLCGRPLEDHRLPHLPWDRSCIKCADPWHSSLPARPENEPARDYDFHGNPPNPPGEQEIFWRGGERWIHAKGKDTRLLELSPYHEHRWRAEHPDPPAPARPKLDKDEGGRTQTCPTCKTSMSMEENQIRRRKGFSWCSGEWHKSSASGREKGKS